MRKLLTFCLLALLLANPVYAQRAWRFPWAKEVPRPTALQGRTKLSTINISRQLDQRMAQTFRQAQQAKKQLPQGYQFMLGEPVKQIFKTEELNAKELYTDQTFLKSSKQTGKYLAARNNRLFLQQIPRIKQLYAQINENLPRLRAEAAETQQPQNSITWLADSIPAQITQLFIGERHGLLEIRQFVAQLVTELKARQPEREIILFTEFLPENLVYTNRPYSLNEIPEFYRIYFPVWNQARQAHIKTIGLELPAAVDDVCAVRYLNAQEHIRQTTVWACLEGVRLRNERWKQTLAAHRAQHPDALFIIYTGAGHSRYNHPFTLATPDKQTFMVAVYPGLGPSNRSSDTFTVKPLQDPLESLVPELDFQYPVIKWKSPDLAPLSGFDVRIEIPVKLPGTDE